MSMEFLLPGGSHQGTVETSSPNTGPNSTFTWATVTQASPLRIRLDGQSAALDSTPSTLKAGLAIGNRVWVQIYGKKAIVIGKAGG